MTLTLKTKDGLVDVIEVIGDLPGHVLDSVSGNRWVGIDSETTGLDWIQDQLGLIQVYIPALKVVYLMRPTQDVPVNLVEILNSEVWTKVFHYALFDLRFLAAAWKIQPTNIWCTKIASKLLWPERAKHSLAGLVEEFVGVEMSKNHNIRTSGWTSEKLSAEQVQYAAFDAIYLPVLFQGMQRELEQVGISELADSCFTFIPIQLQAEMRGVKDLYGY